MYVSNGQNDSMEPGLLRYRDYLRDSVTVMEC